MRSQRHLREIQGYDSAGQSEAGGAIVVDPGSVSFGGNVEGGAGNVGVPYNLNVGAFFGGNDLPFVFSVQAGVLPSGTSLDTATGVISGTPDTITNYTGIVIRCTDASSDTADTNTFAINILA